MGSAYGASDDMVLSSDTSCMSFAMSIYSNS